MNTDYSKKFWRSNLRLMVMYLFVWAFFSFGMGIIWKDYFDQFSIGSAPLGFWFSQQGSIIVFVIIIFAYCFQLNKLEDKYLRLNQTNQKPD